jgi:hypothetical protein
MKETPYLAASVPWLLTCNSDLQAKFSNKRHDPINSVLCTGQIGYITAQQLLSAYIFK